MTIKGKAAVTLHEAAAQLGTTYQMAWERLHAGQFPGAYKEGRRWRIPADELLETALLNKTAAGRQTRAIGGRTARVTVRLIDDIEYVSVPDASKLAGVTRQALYLRLEHETLTSKYAKRGATQIIRLIPLTELERDYGDLEV